MVVPKVSSIIRAAGVIICALLIASPACTPVPSNSPGDEEADTQDEDQTLEGELSALDLIKDPLATEILTYMAGPKTIDERGASGSNIDYENGTAKWVTRFDVADQRHCWQAVARGLAEE